MNRRFLVGALVCTVAAGAFAALRGGDAPISAPQAIVAEPSEAPAVAVNRADEASAKAADTRHATRNSDVTPEQKQAADDLPAGAKPVDNSGACPPEMVQVSGEYCTEVRETCKEWLDDPKLPYARCKVFEKSECVGKRVSMNYCIDRYEYTKPGEELPLNHQSFVTGSKICKAQGKRLCAEQEWNFACEGEEMRPYPYGWERKAVCNQDRDDLYEMKKGHQVLKDHREKSGERDECVSPFGVYNLAGNLDEPTLREGATHNYPFRTALKGGWWMAARNRCRPATTAHDDHYEDIQLGVRCCSDVPGSQGGPNG
ncbi:MAG: SUMF1/EgtB/PvdO family nonheme iron enzyme [Polyangiaceae bacterium]|nr:SUMF1/EgtB/PvdO family nonheme iron enzyme [Myxococcales bacterium]MCB9586755.1 SUMF1/EgtB/PvdO family nonheme iron enzyme [Polyangiaceae bacterium]MCB9606262.1 SUMF1/EgtB/PvdO family nonheme iron enzyme [Polyangiaceae bacterium]